MQKRTGVLMVVFVLAVLGLAFYSSRDSGVGERQAVTQCEGFADKRLKAPASADYNLAASETGDGWLVTGTVDSENSFGAKIRSSVRCVLHFEGSTAYLDDIAIG